MSYKKISRFRKDFTELVRGVGKGGGCWWAYVAITRNASALNKTIFSIPYLF